MPAMKTRRIVLHHRTRTKFLRKARRFRDADTRVRFLIVLRADQGHGGRQIARELGCSAATVSRTLHRYETLGEAGLIDRREDNGQPKVSEAYAQTVLWILQHTPLEHGHRRPTWTARLLIETARRYTSVTVSRRTMGRLLKALRVRRGRPKPSAPCPWSRTRKNRRISMIRGLVESLPDDQACVWEDEADIDLNPRIGFDYMLPGTQRQVMTPGKNVKRYFAAAMDARSDRVMWVKGEKKNSRLFIELLKKLAREYAGKKLIHVILDNFTIHSSRQTRAWLEEHGQNFRLHFLPPYCPDDNRIERKLWREVHANCTVNHRCGTIAELVDEVVHYLMWHNRRAVNLELLKMVVATPSSLGHNGIHRCHGGHDEQTVSARRTLGLGRTASTQTSVRAGRRQAARAGSRLPDGDHLCAQNRPSLGGFSAGDGLLRHDALEPPERMAPSRRLGPTPPAPAGQAAWRRRD